MFRFIRRPSRRLGFFAPNGVALGVVGLAFLAPSSSVAQDHPAGGPGAKPASGESHPFSVHDMVAMERISDHRISPDGKRVVFVLRTTDLAANRGRTDLYLIDIDGKNQTRLTSDPASDSNPRWSADGRYVYFLSTRGGSSQVWRIAVGGGEAEQMTRLPLDVEALNVFGDGRLGISMQVFPGKTPDETKTRLDGEAARKSTGQVYDGLFIRHWDTWKDGRRSHVFVLADPKAAPVDVMKAMDADCPTKPFGGTEDYTFTPDGNGIVFSARDVGKEEAWSTDFDLYFAPIDGSKAPVCLTEENKAWDAQPVFSPDGKTLAYLAMQRPGYEADRFRIMLMDWTEASPGTARRVLTENWDRSPGSITWFPEGVHLLATAGNLGQVSLYNVNTSTGKADMFVENGTVGGVDVSTNGVTVYALDTLQSPVELHTASVVNHAAVMKRITKINDDRVSNARMGDSEQFTFKGHNDETVYGTIVKPVDFDPSKKYPVAFLIHGGPQGSFGNHFHYRWNPQTYAGAGYAAVMVDFHGSTGYGQAFCDSIRNDWGGKPLEDLKKGLEAALAKYPWMNGDRVAALGASYGGYMINWIAGQWPNRFKCLVSHDGNLDERMAYFDTEELWFPEWDHEGTPWTNPEGFTKHNPIDHVDKWKTPMLVIHGGQDFRVVYTQGLSTFTALQRRGIPSRFLYFPDENHWVLKPANSIQWHETVMAWLDQWTK